MPLFLVETIAASSPPVERTRQLLATRFPEVVVEHHFATRRVDGWELWLCRAPGANHLQRWSAAFGLQVSELREVDRIELLTGPVRGREMSQKPTKQRTRP